MNMSCDKLIIAVLQGDDYSEVIRDLNEHGFYATLLTSTGGFMKKRSVTVMIGLEKSRLEEALEVLKTHAGARMETGFRVVPGGVGMAPVPTQIQQGGITVFVLNIESSEKY